MGDCCRERDLVTKQIEAYTIDKPLKVFGPGCPAVTDQDATNRWPRRSSRTRAASGRGGGRLSARLRVCEISESPPPVTVRGIEQRHITWEAPHPGTSGVCLFYRALEEELWKRSPVVFL